MFFLIFPISLPVVGKVYVQEEVQKLTSLGLPTLITYLVNCALNSKDKVHYELEGKKYSAPGGLGLAPHWLKNELNPAEQRWLSACLLSRVNLFGKKIYISMLGTHPQLQVPNKQIQTAQLQEGAFYGNLFADPPELYVCEGRQQEKSADLAWRRCSERLGESDQTRCGFISTGKCFRENGQSKVPACQHEDATTGAFSQCLGKNGKIYEEVITVFLFEKSLKK